MAGTFAEQAQLAGNAEMIAACRVAIIKRAIEIDADSTRETIATLSLVRNILSNSEDFAKRMAWLCAAGNPTIAAAAPAVPSEGDLQFTVNAMLAKLE